MKFHINVLLVAAALWAAFFGSPRRCDGADLSNVVRIYGGFNGVWFDGPEVAFPSDFELGGHAAVSVSPHISVVGALDYGFQHSYVRWGVGPRFTVTDADNRDFSIGLGAQFRDASEENIIPREWVAEASFGWRALPETFPRMLIVGQGAYGLTTSQGSAILGLRWSFPL